MDITIITPYYKGKKYLKKYLKIIEGALTKINNKFSYEVLIINDSPDENVEIDKDIIKKINISIINNKKNEGIHKSRINGINNSKGEYILFLDQDDEITGESLEILLNSIGEYDVCVGNGIYEFENGGALIFKNNISGKFSTKKIFYLYIKDFIVSPGHALIKRSSIPKEWLDNTLTKNGADDYLLWLLMFEHNCKFKYIHKLVYIHKFTGENVSISEDNMFMSKKQVLKILEKCDYNRKDLKRLTASINYKHYYKDHFIIETLKHLKIFIYNVIYKLVWRGLIVEKNIPKI